MGLSLFFVAWITGASYVILMYVLGFRLGWLRKSGRAPSAPYTSDFFFGWLGWSAVAFLFSGRHKQIGDRAATTMVIVCRVLFVIYFPLLAAVFWQFWARTHSAN